MAIGNTGHLQRMAKYFQSEFAQGALRNLAVAPSVAAYASLAGMLSAQKGITLVQMMMWNLLMFAGSAQLVVTDLWTHPIPIFEIVLTVLVVNFRYFLIGASLHPIFAGTSLRHKLLAMHLVVDESWAMTLTRAKTHKTTSMFLVGGGFCLILVWCASTVVGFFMGTIIDHPEDYALDFAFGAVFTAITVSFFRGKSDIFPFAASALVSYITFHFLPGKWYIACGGIAGALAAACRGHRAC